ncbi:prominin-2 isoform X3 [Hippopotamus amphibius kiboko]|uniref:prominin-2 isoform X3 n=1 Tax=Hippopotamus amphibius kiboko TaxID=575201 RepID=UPI00259788D7|nr:prominin-2 isoform X3 [Hippopotamus amphibius kiboko]
MLRAPGLLAALLGLGLGLILTVTPRGAGAADCGGLGPAERLAFAPAARARWLAPRVRAPGPLDTLYGTVRRFLSVVQLNPFPAGGAVRGGLLGVCCDHRPLPPGGAHRWALLLRLPLPPALWGPGEDGAQDDGLRARQPHGLAAADHARDAVRDARLRREARAEAPGAHAHPASPFLLPHPRRIGVVSAFVTNQRVHEQMGPSAEAVPETLLSLRGLVSDVPQELQAVAQQFSLPQEQVLEELDGVGRSIGNMIHTQLKSTVYGVLASVLSLGQALQVSVNHLRALNATSVELQEGQQTLAPAVQGHREHLLALLQEPSCQGCAEALNRAHALELGADFSQVPSVADVLHRLKGVPEANFSSMVQEPLLLWAELKKVVAQQPRELRTLADAFPGWEGASRWSQALEEVEQSSRPYLKDVQRYERYRWIVGCVLCSVVLLVVVCNLLGLNLGIWGLSAREDPSHSEAKGEAGARFLMVSVGFSFLFAAPLILFVFATFLVGGNMQTLVCRSWESGELYEFADTPGNMPSSMNLSQLLGLKKNLSILLAYQQCKQGAALWTVLQLNDSYDLEKHLDISQYTAKLQEELQKLNVDVKNLDLLSPAARRDLKALQNSGLESIHYPAFLVEIQKPVVNTSVEKLAQELEGLSQTQGNAVLGQQLQKEAQGLRNLHQEKLLPQQSLVAKLNLSVQALASSAPHLQPETSGVLDRVAYLKGELPTWATRILRNESECFLTREMGYFYQYVTWVREEVTQRIATCQPLSGALDNGRVILCDMVADPWNAFWFCLGWCTFFLIPSIIFAVKTSKYFRPIRKRLRDMAAGRCKGLPASPTDLAWTRALLSLLPPEPRRASRPGLSPNSNYLTPSCYSLCTPFLLMTPSFILRNTLTFW